MKIVKEELKVPDTEFSVPFVQGMADRMAVSFSKYGHVDDAAVKKFDPLANLITRLNKYKETGNTEWLQDVGNCAMIEFMFPQHPNAHYRATDSSESPGRNSRATGELTDAANTQAVDNRRLGGSALKTSGGHYRKEGD
jgi:hypothetical protein